jgi:hypothetical protein
LAKAEGVAKAGRTEAPALSKALSAEQGVLIGYRQRAPARVLGCLTRDTVTIVISPDVGLADGGVPVQLPIEAVLCHRICECQTASLTFGLTRTRGHTPKCCEGANQTQQTRLYGSER